MNYELINLVSLVITILGSGLGIGYHLGIRKMKKAMNEELKHQREYYEKRMRV